METKDLERNPLVQNINFARSTYDSVTFYPGEYLNVIIGPNGTGKSTLVAAIVLGMGGSPKVLSRSLNVSDYIYDSYHKSSNTYF